MTEWRWPQQECFHTDVYVHVDFTWRGVKWIPLWCRDCGYKFDQEAQ